MREFQKGDGVTHAICSVDQAFFPLMGRTLRSIIAIRLQNTNCNETQNSFKPTSCSYFSNLSVMFVLACCYCNRGITSTAKQLYFYVLSVEI